MSTSILLFTERNAEVRAQAEAAQVIRIIGELVDQPSSKKFANSRAQRLERWVQLQACASKQVSGLQSLAKQAARPRARTVTPPATANGASAPTITPSDVQQAAG